MRLPSAPGPRARAVIDSATAMRHGRNGGPLPEASSVVSPRLAVTVPAPDCEPSQIKLTLVGRLARGEERARDSIGAQ